MVNFLFNNIFKAVYCCKFPLEGTVEKLERDTGATSGRIALRAAVSGQTRRVWAQLPEGFYHIAVLAHDGKAKIRCVGQLTRPGRSYELAEVVEFALSESASVQGQISVAPLS